MAGGLNAAGLLMYGNPSWVLLLMIEISHQFIYMYIYICTTLPEFPILLVYEVCIRSCRISTMSSRVALQSLRNRAVSQLSQASAGEVSTESLYNVVFYYTLLYYTILYYTILYYTILYYTILYYTILYYTILYYTILYYTILYYTIVYGVLRRTRTPCGPSKR